MDAGTFFLLVWYAIVFGAPIYACNSFASLSKFIPFLGVPVDGGKNWKDGRRIFGDHKTWRGIIFGIIFGTITGVVVWYLCYIKWDVFVLADKYTASFSPTKSAYPVFPWYIGFFMSIGDHFADLLGSFIKRRINIPSGGALPLYDQGSWAVTGLLFALPFVWGVSHLWFYVIAVIIVTPALHFVTNIAAYFLKLKDVWY